MSKTVLRSCDQRVPVMLKANRKPIQNTPACQPLSSDPQRRLQFLRLLDPSAPTFG